MGPTSNARPASPPPLVFEGILVKTLQGCKRRGESLFAAGRGLQYPAFLGKKGKILGVIGRDFGSFPKPFLKLLLRLRLISRDSLQEFQMFSNVFQNFVKKRLMVMADHLGTSHHFFSDPFFFGTKSIPNRYNSFFGLSIS